MKWFSALVLVLLGAASHAAEFDWNFEDCGNGQGLYREGYCPPVLTVNGVTSVTQTSASVPVDTTRGAGDVNSELYCLASTTGLESAQTIVSGGENLTVTGSAGTKTVQLSGLSGSTAYTPLCVQVWDGRTSLVYAGTQFVTQSAGGQAFSYAGIPYPTSPQPAAIMPTLPTPSNVRNGFPYDPIATPNPTWQDLPNQYFHNSAAGNCNDSNNGGRGSPAAPRCTPYGATTGANGTWTLAAGDQLFFVGEGASYFSYQHMETINWIGTAAQPIWFVGVNADGTASASVEPELRMERFADDGAGIVHVLMDNIHFASPTDNFRMLFGGTTNEYFTFRNGECSGSHGTFSNPSRRCFSIGGSSTNPTQFIVIHNNDIYGFGRWQDDYDTSRDLLGIQLQKWSRYVWITNNRIYHMQGDSVMCGNSNWWDQDRASRPHYIYLGGNEFYENYENGFDQKGCYHLIFSSNHVHDFYNSVKGANASAVTMEQNSEGDLGGRYNFFWLNRVENTGNAFNAQCTTDDCWQFVISNLVRNFSDTAFQMSNRCYSGPQTSFPGGTCADGVEFTMNTVDCSGATGGGNGARNVQGPTPSDHETTVDGNIYYECTDGAEGSVLNFESWIETGALNIRDNVFWRTSGGIAAGNQATRADVHTGNQYNANPLFTNQAAGDYTLQGGSPAIGAMLRVPEGITVFESLYPPSMTTGLRDAVLGGTSAPFNAGAKAAHFN